MPRPVIQSYKKVLLFADASFAAGNRGEQTAIGTDSVAAGQTSATDPAVPTGSIIKYIEFQLALNNGTPVPCYVNVAIQYLLESQGVVDPDSVGGSGKRNQTLHMEMFSVGADQNSNHKFRFKVPKRFQRLREGMQWQFVWNNTATVNRKLQIIYKFYR